MRRWHWKALQHATEDDIADLLFDSHLEKTTSPSASYAGTQIGCKKPCNECLALEYAQAAPEYGKQVKHRCVRSLVDPPKELANTSYETPSGEVFQICDSLVFDWVLAQNPQRPKKVKKSPNLRRPEKGETTDILAWADLVVAKASLRTDGVGEAARDLRANGTECSPEDWCALIAFVGERLEIEQPWRKPLKESA